MSQILIIVLSPQINQSHVFVRHHPANRSSNATLLLFLYLQSVSHDSDVDGQTKEPQGTASKGDVKYCVVIVCYVVMVCCVSEGVL